MTVLLDVVLRSGGDFVPKTPITVTCGMDCLQGSGTVCIGTDPAATCKGISAIRYRRERSSRVKIDTKHHRLHSPTAAHAVTGNLQRAGRETGVHSMISECTMSIGHSGCADRHYAVIGAGLAGLATAYSLLVGTNL